ncbi:MAG: hypothetical protein KGV50_03680 [Gammaproteobacteria bacterium]|nr:hypothetical protein [Gammaproteobacteria bacterium]
MNQMIVIYPFLMKLPLLAKNWIEDLQSTVSGTSITGKDLIEDTQSNNLESILNYSSNVSVVNTYN